MPTETAEAKEGRPAELGEAGDGVTPLAKSKKMKSFKRIRGFLLGSRKSKNKVASSSRSTTATTASRTGNNLNVKDNSKARGLTARSSTGEDDGEGSTVYRVDVDDQSLRSKITQDAKNGTPGANSSPPQQTFLLKIVLLLMDAKTRRFELLQLEFDSLKALVSDVLAQIPVSVTEEALRTQSYSGICTSDGNQRSLPTLLADFCKGNEVLVAVPTEMPPVECIRLAKPILNDEKVFAMLLSSGIDATGWKDIVLQKKKRSIETSKPQGVPSSTRSVVLPKREPRNKKGISLLPSLMFCLASGSILQIFHLYISAPIKPGNIVAPGIWLSKCGIMFFSSSCSNAYFSMDKNGRAVFLDSKNELAWELRGAVCPEEDTACVRGMQLLEDGTIVIGGKMVEYVNLIKPSAALSPWPFEEAPRVFPKIGPLN